MKLKMINKDPYSRKAAVNYKPVKLTLVGGTLLEKILTEFIYISIGMDSSKIAIIALFE